MKIRSAINEDVKVLLKFEQELIKFERPFDSILKNGRISYYDISKRIKAKNSHVLIVEDSGEIIGSGIGKTERFTTPPKTSASHPLISLAKTIS